MKIVKGILAVVAGIVVGSLVNFGILMLSNAVFGLPDGMNLFDAESVKANAHKLTMANFAGTLLAHQFGTFVGAFVAAKIAPSAKMIFAIAIGAWFLLGGIYAATLIPAPLWFVVGDLALYIPVAFLAAKIGGRR
ncbi:MAG: hypothetical protein HS105_10475 [Chloracidobacterium sp.]|nr:hypothetical protein [Chloracidobacterium sp.]MCO5333681.1 hypothetical protein [Pyrinomonadaceae bacterium]